MDLVFKTEANDKPVGQQLGQQVADSDPSNAEGQAETPADLG
jgi:hypothetical protein